MTLTDDQLTKTYVEALSLNTQEPVGIPRIMLQTAAQAIAVGLGEEDWEEIGLRLVRGETVRGSCFCYRVIQ